MAKTKAIPAATDMKSAIWEAVLKNIRERLERCQMEKQGAQDAANQEGKSSAGDKYETGRAMAQRQVAELQLQELQWQQMLDKALLWQTAGSSAQIAPGSLIRLGDRWMLIGPGLGLCTTENGISFLSVSVSAPVGQMVLGKKQGDSVLFQGNSMRVEEIL
jgi:hypothetical protein